MTWTIEDLASSPPEIFLGKGVLKICSKCDFNKVALLEVNGKGIWDQAKINDEIKIFFEEAFKRHKG